ncbi:MAG TPA: BREX-3 system phosphatase PglZ [Actinomycetota bacterium]|nr:BREX-3 system phosphatase PglZ [Actinomycetota bacterium]
MRRWLARQLAPIERSDRLLAVVLDPEDAVRPDDVDAFGEVEVVRGWFELRRAYEHRGRRRAREEGRLVLLLKHTGFRERRDLPYDIDRASVVAEVAVPGPPWLRDVLLALPDDLSDEAAGVIERTAGDPLEALLERLWGVRSAGGDAARELDLVIRLRSDPTAPDALWGLLVERLRWEPARALCDDPPDPRPLQRLWAGWVKGQDGGGPVFAALGPRLAPLFHLGFLRPEPAGAVGLPSWARLGVAEAGPRERAEELLGAKPATWPPADVSDWLAAAEWWGEVRAALAEAGAAAAGLKEEAWAAWRELDQAFGPWLRARFGGLMTLTTRLPLTVDKIAPFLARRLREGRAERIVLVVVDGMGLAQWSTLRRAARLSVVESGASFAMIPTLTPVSRQAIFAGRPALAFADTIRETGVDARRWRKFWEGEGVGVGGVSYARVSGGLRDADLPLGRARIIGVVVNAVDEIMHGAHLLGDTQMAAGLLDWAGHGFLRSLVSRAVDAGYEVWVTSDHGNLESEPLGRVHEGLAVESAGVRVRWYPDPILREAARAEGIAWDPPGLPEGVCYPLFAPGRGGYFSGDLRVTHGGISLDEVVVPLARVEP